MLTTDIKRKIDSARDILVGKVPDPKAQVEQITNALIYKFMDDMDQESVELGGKPRFFNNGYEKYAWSKLMDPKLGGLERLNLYIEAITKLSQNPHLPQLFRDIFKDAYLPYRDPETLSLFLKQINEFTYHHSEELGNSFEYLLSVLGSQGDAGQFRTPRHIIDFIVAVVDPKKTDRILDPACGTAGFLISAYKHILASHDGKDETGQSNDETRLTPDERKRLVKSVVGYDISPDMVKLSRVNMYLHGFPEPHISEYDTLTSEDNWDDTFDVILANPPFMTPKGGIRPHKRFSVQANRAEVLFIDYIVEHLSPHGRGGVIVPEGIIFQSGNAYKQLRKMLIENYLYAVVSLPAGIFQPYSGVKTSILFFDPDLAKRSKSILFVKIENDGRTLGSQRRVQDGNQLDPAKNVITEFRRNPGITNEALKASAASKPFFTIGKSLIGGIDAIGNPGEIESLQSEVVSKEKIAGTSDYNLSGDRYLMATDYTNARWPIVELGELEKEGQIEFLRGQGLSKSDLTSEGKKKCIHYGELYTLYDPIIKEVVSKTNFDGKVTSSKGDVLVPATTTADAMGIAIARSLNEDGVIIGGDINIIRTLNDQILSDYLALLISNPPLKQELAKSAKGANILHLSNSDLRRLQFPLPPLEVQRKIVIDLDGYQKITNAAHIILTNYKVNISINPEWPIVKLGELADNLDSKRKPVTKSDRMQGEYPYYGATGIVDYVDQFLFNEKLVLIGEDGAKWDSGENTAFIAEGKYWVNNHAHVLRPKRDQILDEFLVAIINQTDVKPYITGITVPKLNQQRLNDIPIPLPEINEQQKIVIKILFEQSVLRGNKELIATFEKKIRDKIAEIWAE